MHAQLLYAPSSRCATTAIPRLNQWIEPLPHPLALSSVKTQPPQGPIITLTWLRSQGGTSTTIPRNPILATIARMCTLHTTHGRMRVTLTDMTMAVILLNTTLINKAILTITIPMVLALLLITLPTLATTPEVPKTDIAHPSVVVCHSLPKSTVIIAKDLLRMATLRHIQWALLICPLLLRLYI